MKKILSICLLIFVAALVPQPAAHSQQLPIPGATIVDGTAEVLFSSAQRASRNSAVKVEGLSGGHGSGTYIEVDNHYLIITARHVVDRSEIYYVSTVSERVIGQVIWKSQTKDMAVLRIPRLVSRNAVSLQRMNELDIGSEITYTGYPASYELLTTKAYVSGHAQERGATLLQGFVWFGYSGSGGFDSSGRLRAIIFAIGAESYRGAPQLLETLVYSHEINRRDIAQIKEVL
jgi:S1-C subfamily serine protease